MYTQGISYGTVTEKIKVTSLIKENLFSFLGGGGIIIVFGQ
jgi:hypothetical protein